MWFSFVPRSSYGKIFFLVRKVKPDEGKTFLGGSCANEPMLIFIPGKKYLEMTSK